MNPPARPIPNAYWVIPGRFLAGEYPGGFGDERVRKRMDAFLSAGIDTFFNLTRKEELPPYQPLLVELAGYYDVEVRHLHFPIQDFGLPTREHMTSILDAIDSAIDAGRNIYVHCWGGVGRTGTVVGCYLVRHGMTGEQALAQLAEWWKHDPRQLSFHRTPETDEQVQFIRDWSSGEHEK